MKKLVSVVLVMMTVVCIIGCGSKEVEEEKPDVKGSWVRTNLSLDFPEYLDYFVCPTCKGLCGIITEEYKFSDGGVYQLSVYHTDDWEQEIGDMHKLIDNQSGSWEITEDGCLKISNSVSTSAFYIEETQLINTINEKAVYEKE